ncbi:MAG: NUDIX hydrolase [Candidatus Levyibacteriota bacterium]
MIACKFEDGGKANLRHVAVDTIVVQDNKVLLAKRTKKILEGGKWGLIAGFMERDEDLYQAAQREIFEETGYRVENITLLRVKHWSDRPNEDRQNVAFVFFATATSLEGKKDWESDEIKWFPLDATPLKEDIAFDHADDIEIYREYLREKFSLPLLQKT